MLRHTITIVALLTTACSTQTPYLAQPTAPPSAQPPESAAAREKANDIVLYALGLIDSGYRYGGKNPEAGLDCSGMVSHIYRQAAGIRVSGSAADIAKLGRPVAISQLKPGDLVFFNTRNKPYSHVGIYIGDGRFVHAPNSHGKIRTESLTQGWFAQRLEEARTYFN